MDLVSRFISSRRQWPEHGVQISIAFWSENLAEHFLRWFTKLKFSGYRLAFKGYNAKAEDEVRRTTYHFSGEPGNDNAACSAEQLLEYLTAL